jgi:hypothetical protein
MEGYLLCIPQGRGGEGRGGQVIFREVSKMFGM